MFVELHIQLPVAKGAPYLLKPFHPNQTLVYFQNIAFRGIAEEDRNPDLIDIGLEIFNKCAHNLHAMKVIAFILLLNLLIKKSGCILNFFCLQK